MKMTILLKHDIFKKKSFQILPLSDLQNRRGLLSANSAKKIPWTTVGGIIWFLFNIGIAALDFNFRRFAKMHSMDIQKIKMEPIDEVDLTDVFLDESSIGGALNPILLSSDTDESILQQNPVQLNINK